jgi:head-tail adaptor
MNPGRLDRRIRIEAPTVTKEAIYGSPSISWAPFATLSANIQEVLPSQAEHNVQGLRIAARRARVRTRYVADITSDMRVVYLDRGNRLMKILTPPVELGRREGLEFMVADYSTQGDAA